MLLVCCIQSSNYLLNPLCCVLHAMDLLHDVDAVLRTNRNWAGKMAVMPKKNVDVGILIGGMERGEGSGLSALNAIGPKPSKAVNADHLSPFFIRPWRNDQWSRWE